jgi:diguanylate cyclase (GGDEF)-like protein
MHALAEANAVGTGFALVLAGMVILTAYFALQTFHLRRQLRKREEQRRRLQVAAYIDPLTQLPNRSVFEDRLRHALEMSERRQTTAAIMVIDLDDFKQVNEEYGRRFGDEVLAEFAVRCRERLRLGDTLARWGSDELTVLVEDLCDTCDIEHIVNRLREAIAQPFVVEGREIGVSVSIGVAMGCTAGESPEELLRVADAAMYRAKRTQPERGFELVLRQTCMPRVAPPEAVADKGQPATAFIRYPV